MADSDLYNVLSNLNLTDSKLWAKTKGLSGELSTISGSLNTKIDNVNTSVAEAFEAGKVVIGKANGITSSVFEIGGTTQADFGSQSELAVESAVTGYVADAIAAVNAAQGTALTGVIGSDTIAVTNGNKNVSLSAITDNITIGQDASGIKSLLTLKKLDTPASATFAATYELQNANGQKIGDQINIVKDQFLNNAAYDAETEELVLTFNVPSGTLESRIDVKDMVHEYEGSNAIEVGNTVNGESTISLKLDTSSTGTEAGDGKFLSITANGLLLSGVQAAIDAASNDATAGLTDLSSALTDYLSGNAVKNAFTAVNNDISYVSGVISSDIDPRLTGAEADIDALEAKTSGAITTDHVVMGGASGQYVDGGRVLGSDSTLSGDFGGTNNANTLATEAAVKSYVTGAIATTVSPDTVTAPSALATDTIVLGNANNKTVKTTGVSIRAQGSNEGGQLQNSDTEVPTSKAVIAYVNDGLSGLLESIQSLQNQIDGITE